jgi:serine/threonine protein kinase
VEWLKLTNDHPFYYPRCTKIFEEEVRYLQYCRGFPNVARLIGMVNSQNPFKTNIHGEGPHVITGMLLKYYPNGTLEDAIDSKDRRGLRQSWTKQLAPALLTLHGVGITHLDIKPANVVFDATNEATRRRTYQARSIRMLGPELMHLAGEKILD